jgi:hypothetical protein
MNKKNILETIAAHTMSIFKTFSTEIIEDYLYFINNDDGYEFKSAIRCQNFGEVYLINPKSHSIKCVDLENLFSSLVHESLKPLNDSSVTLMVSAQGLGIGERIIDYQIRTKDDLENYCHLFVDYIYELKRVFFEPMKDPLILSKFISNYSFENNLKFNTGGQFPIQTFKKIFILFVGGQMDRYLEYKLGLESQLNSLPLRKPEKKQDAIKYLENYTFLIQELETGKIDLNKIQ